MEAPSGGEGRGGWRCGGRFLEELPDTALLPMLMAARGNERTGWPCAHFARFFPAAGTPRREAIAAAAAGKAFGAIRSQSIPPTGFKPNSQAG